MSAPVVHAAVYDLGDEAGLRQARRHRDCWGKLYTELHPFDPDHIALVFRPAPDERWRDWERVRLQEILSEQAT